MLTKKTLIKNIFPFYLDHDTYYFNDNIINKSQQPWFFIRIIATKNLFF